MYTPHQECAHGVAGVHFSVTRRQHFEKFIINKSAESFHEIAKLSSRVKFDL